ncbi:MAG TPA: two-component regulator propeller domain-containing protein, partial [Sphingobacteriaceae bacterium]
YQFNKKNPQSLGNNFVFSITEFDKKTLWVATQGGVYIFDLERESFTKFAPLKDISVYDILRDQRGLMWMGTKSDGLFCYNPKSKKTTNYKVSRHANSISSNHIRKLVEDHAGNIWIGTFGHGIDVFDPVKKVFKNYNTGNSGLSSDFILTLYKDITGDIWAGTFAGGLNHWKRSSGTFKSFRKSDGNSINDDIVRAIYQPSPGKLYIGTEKGLNVLNLTTNQFTSVVKKANNPFGLSDNAIYTICADREGGIWVGTFFGGANYLQEKSLGFELYYPTGERNSLSGSAVSAFLEDKPGMFWVGTEDGGLNYYNSFNNTFKQYPFESGQQKLSYHNIHSLFKDSKGNIWIGTFAGGLNVYNPSTGRVKNYKNNPSDPSSISNNNIYSIYEDKDHVIWVGTTKGLNIYDPQKDAFKLVKEMGLGDNIIYDIYEDDTKTIWFATYDIGLISNNKRSGKWKQYLADGKKGSLSSNKIICILDDHSGNLWLGTDGGSLNRLNLQDKTVTVFDETTGMDGNVVYGILQDDNRTLWISTNNGLYNFIPYRNSFKQFTNWDNLQSRQFNYNAYYKSSSGKLYFGGIKGFNSFYPDSVRDVNISNKIAFTNFQLFNKDVKINDPESPIDKPINYSERIILSHDQSVISIEYAALSFVAPNKTKYAYKMEGFDKEWNYVGTQRKATYTNLPAGNYVFKVKAAGNDGNWNSEGTSIRLTVNPPFYQSVWAYILYTFAAVGIFIAFRRYTINQTRKENEIKLERINSKKEQEFYSQKIEFFTAMAHEIRTPLSLIIAPLEKLLSSNNWKPDEQKQLSVMDENSGRLLTLVNQLLDFRRIESEFYTIYKEETDLVSLVHSIYSRFSAMSYQKGVKFTLSTKVSKLLVQIDPEAFTKILNNLLINAFKFTRTKVKIGINEPQQNSDGEYFFSVTVEDDGIGIPASEIDDIFKKFFKVSSGDHHYSNLGGTGIGLALAKALVEKHNGNLEVSSKEKVNTIFKIIIPYTVSEEVPVQVVEDLEEDAANVLDEDSTTILVVEDDLSLNDFITQSLKAEGFKVFKATTGREALDVLEEYRIDLILSDVMMPVMDGMELCSNIKSNINYSHIPLVLLTARSNSESEIAAIETGADSYIVKPFKWKHVSAVIKNLLESRVRLKNKFAEQPFAKANSLTTNSRDKKFLDKVIEIIEQRITDPQLSVEELSKDLAMSRSSLHKKLKSLSGYVPNEFIRLIRLKKAAQLILSQEYNISEISYLVGFNSHSYFSKCFVSQFKMPPSEFIEKHKEGVIN